MAILVVALHMDTFFNSSFKFDLPVFGSHHGSTLKAASLVELGSEALCYAAKVQFGLDDFALSSGSFALFPLVYFVLPPVDSGAAFNPLGKFPSILQPF